MINQELNEIVNKIDKKELVNFLVKYLSYDENILNDFRSNFVTYFPKMTQKDYRNKIWNAIKGSGGKDGYIDYNEVWNYSRSMHNFVHESEKMIENKDYTTAFYIVSEVLDSIPNTDIDDSSGTTGDIADDCIEVIETILEYTLVNDLELSKQILDYLLHEVKMSRLSNYGVYVYPLLNCFIDKQKYVSEIETTLNDYILNKSKDSWLKTKYQELLDIINNGI